MRTPVPDYLAELLDACGQVADGELADYIPELAQVDPEVSAAALATVTGSVHGAGATEHEFTIQSMSKPFAYALAMLDRGIDGVAAYIDVEPSGEAFNEISLDETTGHPRNPMINAGAIAAHGLIEADSAGERVARIVDFLGRLAGRELQIDEAVAASEWESAHRNLALGHLLASAGMLVAEAREVVGGYVRQCSVKVTVTDIAQMAATLANGGVQPATGERLMEPLIARQVLSVMATCGMYDAAGDWMSTVGIPAKSGVSGGIIGVLPGQVGVATFSPRLDAHGNSARGVAMMRRLSDDMGMHLMNPVRPARSAMRSVRVDGDATVYELHGDLVFVSVESLLCGLQDEPPATGRVVFDLTRVDEISDVARKMAAEAARRLRLDGLDVSVVGGGFDDEFAGL